MGRVTKSGVGTRNGKGGTVTKLTKAKTKNVDAKVEEVEEVSNIVPVILDACLSSDESEGNEDYDIDVDEVEEDEEAERAKENGGKGVKGGKGKGNKDVQDDTSCEKSDDSSSDEDEVVVKRVSGRASSAKKEVKNIKKEGNAGAKVVKSNNIKAAVKKVVRTAKKRVGKKGKKTDGEKKFSVGQVVAAGGNEGGAGTVKNVVVKDLAAFGIVGAAQVDLKGSKDKVKNTSRLRVVIVDGVNGNCDILFRCEATGDGNNKSSWCEKLLADAIKEDNSWARKLNFSLQTFNWYDNDVLQLNPNGYPIRLFHIPVSLSALDVSDDSLLELCQHICKMLTTSPRNMEAISAVAGNLTWMTGEVVWADVVGNAKALSMVRHLKGIPYLGFYEEHESFILTYFKRESDIVRSQLFGPALEEESSNEEE